MRLPFKLFSLFAAFASSNAVLHGMTAKQQARLRAKALRERFCRMARYPVRPRPSDSGPYPEPDPHQSSPIFRRGRGSDGSGAIYVHSSDSECHEDSGANARPSSSSSGLHSATAETGMHESMSQSVVQHNDDHVPPTASSVATTIIDGDSFQSQSDNEMPQQDMPQQSQTDSLLQALLTADKPQQDQDMPQQAQDMPQPLHGEPQQAQDMPQQAQDMPQQAQDPPSPPSLHGEPVEESIDDSLMLAQDDGWDPRCFRNPTAAQITRWMQGALRH